MVPSNLLPVLTDQNWIIIQQHERFTVLISTLKAPEPRSVIFHAYPDFADRLSCAFDCLGSPPHATAARINLCEGVERDTLVPRL